MRNVFSFIVIIGVFVAALTSVDNMPSDREYVNNVRIIVPAEDAHISEEIVNSIDKAFGYWLDVLETNGNLLVVEVIDNEGQESIKVEPKGRYSDNAWTPMSLINARGEKVTRVNSADMIISLDSTREWTPATIQTQMFRKIPQGFGLLEKGNRNDKKLATNFNRNLVLNDGTPYLEASYETLASNNDLFFVNTDGTKEKFAINHQDQKFFISNFVDSYPSESVLHASSNNDTNIDMPTLGVLQSIGWEVKASPGTPRLNINLTENEYMVIPNQETGFIPAEGFNILFTSEEKSLKVSVIGTDSYSWQSLPDWVGEGTVVEVTSKNKSYVSEALVFTI